jgi:hypothetical protein
VTSPRFSEIANAGGFLWGADYGFNEIAKSDADKVLPASKNRAGERILCGEDGRWNAWLAKTATRQGGHPFGRFVQRQDDAGRESIRPNHYSLRNSYQSG